MITRAAATAAPLLRRRSRFRATCALIPWGDGVPTRVLAHGAKKRAPPPVWLALKFPFLASYYGNVGAKFSKRFGSYRKFEWVGCAVRALVLSNGAQSRPSQPSVKRKVTILYQGKTLIFQGRNPLGECLVSWGINHEWTRINTNRCLNGGGQRTGKRANQPPLQLRGPERDDLLLRDD